MKLSKAKRAALTAAAYGCLYGDAASGRWGDYSNPACNALLAEGLIRLSTRDSTLTRYLATREGVRLLWTSDEDVSPDRVVVAEVNTPHFSFHAIGSSRAHARWLVELMWAAHGRQYQGGDWESVLFPSDVFEVRFLDGEIGATFRDGERLDS